MLEAFLFAACGTLGYAITYNIPKKLLLLAAVTGGCGWLVFFSVPESPVMGCFLAAIVVGVLGEVFSRLFKDAATLFILPGILPLVPGARMYRMTLSLLEKDFDTAASLAIEVLSFAGSIALALLLVTSFSRFVFKVIRIIKMRKLKKQVMREKKAKVQKAAQPSQKSQAAGKMQAAEKIQKTQQILPVQETQQARFQETQQVITQEDPQKDTALQQEVAAPQEQPIQQTKNGGEPPTEQTRIP